jgi:hypothetical protein
MSELIEEDVVGGCTRVSKVEPNGIRLPWKAIYSYTTLYPKSQEIDLWTSELFSPQSSL